MIISKLHSKIILNLHSMKRIFTLLAFVFLATNLIAQTCNALDQTFGVSGKQAGLVSNDWVTPMNIIVQPDNKIVQFGGVYQYGPNLSMIRYNTDGSVDNTFGQSGRVISSTLQSAAFGALQNDGKFVIAGSINNGGFALSRYDQSGTIDVGFGTVGTVVAGPADQNNFARGVAIQTDAKIVAVGSTAQTNKCLDNRYGGQFCPNAFTVFRFKNDGTLDGSFGADGKVVTPVGPDSAGVASSIIVQGDGRIVVSGFYLYNLSFDDYYGSYYYASSHFIMTRYLSNGVVDSSFGENGIAGHTSELQSVNAMSIQADGKILVTGYGGHPFQVERYNSDGSIDSSFGIDGKQFNSFVSWATSIVVSPNNKIFMAGGTSRDFLVARLNGDGSFDSSFNGSGKLSLHFGSPGSYDGASGIALQGSHVIVGGFSTSYDGYTNTYSQLVTRLRDTIAGLAVHITPHGTLTPCQGNSTKLVVNVNGTIQWTKNGGIITGATDTVYYAQETGDYSVSVQNANGCGQSDPVRIVTNGLPVTITPSGSLILCEGDSVKLTSSESGDLQWYKDGVPIGGAKDTVFVAKATGGYLVWVYNAKGCGQSSEAWVSVNSTKPSIQWNGTNLQAVNSSYYYQWYLNGDSIPGANNYFFKPTQLGIYKVVIPDYKCNNTSDDFNLDCNIIAVSQPTIFWNGSALAVSPGGFTDYQWYFNGDSITGAHTNALVTTQMGIYKVIVTGNFGCQKTSNELNLNCTTLGPPKPPNTWDGAKFNTTSGYAHYQWYQNDTAIAGATSNTYTPGPTQFGDYKVVVTDNNNCTNTSDKLPYYVTAASNITIGDARVRFYPNPTTSVLNIDISAGISRKLHAELYDLNGKLLQKKLLNQANNQLRLERLSAGLYQLVIFSGPEKLAVKIAVIK